ncbi:MAG: acetate--CoA ligase family protein [Anaerolineae bacterium]|nr:acetate--CoA ligase family protein [Anaerolineae bacterium]
MELDVLNAVLKPKSIAVIGASATPGKIGYTVVDNLVTSQYEGAVYPINPGASEILGFKAYPSILEVPGEVDMAVFTIPAKLVLNAIEECGKKGVKGLVVITSGFGEVGKTDLEREMVEIAHRYGMRILGPNIVGVLSNSMKMNASFAPTLPLPGKGALVSQSGALLIAIDMSTFTRRVGFDKLVSIGNMSDIEFADLIEWFDQDDDTTSISLYIEGLKNGRKFMEVSQKATKPIIALKSGVSAHGAAAAASHTGSLAGAAKVYGAAFEQAGVIQASDLNNLFDRSLALSLQPPMNGENLLIITNGGGVGVLATDAAERYGIPLKFAPEDVQAELKKHMPEFGSAKNPADLTGQASAEWYENSVRNSFAHPWVDGLTVLYCEVAVTDPMDVAVGIKRAIDESGVKGKPLTVSFVGGEKTEAAMQWLVEQGIPAYDDPDSAVNAMAALREYALMREHDATFTKADTSSAKEKAMKIIAAARADGRDALTEIEAKKVFEAYGLPVPKCDLAATEAEAIQMANTIGYPIVMKIVSPEILHKSDAGGVKVNIKNAEECRQAFNTIMENARNYNPAANLHGVVIQEMAPWGTEVILGSINDPTFGPTVMFGLGGIFVEVLKDVTFRVAPISEKRANVMVNEIKSAPILKGVRGEEPKDRAALAKTIANYSNMVFDLIDEVSESDANPVIVYEEGQGVSVVDARMILKK